MAEKEIQCPLCGIPFEPGREVDGSGNICTWYSQCTCKVETVSFSDDTLLEENTELKRHNAELISALSRLCDYRNENYVPNVLFEAAEKAIANATTNQPK